MLTRCIELKHDIRDDTYQYFKTIKIAKNITLFFKSESLLSKRIPKQYFPKNNYKVLLISFRFPRNSQNVLY